MISIIVPVYNAEAYLSDCIQSILHQTYPHFELLLMNDGSTDGSGAICEAFAQKDSRVKVFCNPNCGVSRSRNFGLAQAKGEYIAFCDADDQYKPNYLMELYQAAEHSGADLVICKYSYLKNTSEIPVNSRESGPIQKEEIYRRIFLDNTIGGFVWNKLFRRTAIGSIRMDETMQICEDTYFVCKVLQHASRVHYIGESLYLYRLHPNSTMSRVQNLFDAGGHLKYALVYERILQEGLVEPSCAPYVQADECVLAISAKCDYLNSTQTRNPAILRNLNQVIRRHFRAMVTCPFYTPRKKAIYIANAFLNIRKYKRVHKNS